MDENTKNPNIICKIYIRTRLMKKPETYYSKTCTKVAEELGMSRSEVSLNIRMFFRSFHIAAENWMWVKIRGFFKFRMAGYHWRKAMRRGYIDSKYDYNQRYHPKFAINRK